MAEVPSHGTVLVQCYRPKVEDRRRQTVVHSIGRTTLGARGFGCFQWRRVLQAVHLNSSALVLGSEGLKHMLQQSAGQQSGRWARSTPAFLQIGCVEETKVLSDLAHRERSEWRVDREKEPVPLLSELALLHSPISYIFVCVCVGGGTHTPTVGLLSHCLVPLNLGNFRPSISNIEAGNLVGRPFSYFSLEDESFVSKGVESLRVKTPILQVRTPRPTEKASFT